MRTRKERMDPPDVNALTPPYATWVELRHPNFKTHPTIGQAKSALTVGCFDEEYDDETDMYVASATRNGFLYKYVSGEGWVLDHAVAPGDDKNVHPLWNTYVIQEMQELTNPSRSKKKS